MPEEEADLAQPSAGVVEMIGAQGDAVAAFDVVLQAVQPTVGIVEV